MAWMAALDIVFNQWICHIRCVVPNGVELLFADAGWLCLCVSGSRQFI